MKNIPNKELSEKQVKIILSNYKINSGGESTICESDKSYTLYKIFTKDNSPIEMSDNKEKKIVRLHELDIEHSTKPISTISMNGKLIGYGPIRAAHGYYRIDEYHLSKGFHNIVVELSGYNCNTFYVLNTLPFLQIYSRTQYPQHSCHQVQRYSSYLRRNPQDFQYHQE